MDVMHVLHDIITSPWIYGLIFVVTVIDSFMPLLPSESVVITAAVFSATGRPAVIGVFGAALVGAVLGDHLIYWVGRGLGRQYLARLQRRSSGTKQGRIVAWVRRELHRRGGPVLIVARYVPGARTIAALTMGATGFRHRHFTIFTVIAGLLWATVTTMSGYIGGATFQDHPLFALLLGFGVALVLAGVLEALRKLRRGPASELPPM